MTSYYRYENVFYQLGEKTYCRLDFNKMSFKIGKMESIEDYENKNIEVGSKFARISKNEFDKAVELASLCLELNIGIGYK